MYSQEIEKLLEKEKIEVGNRVSVEKGDTVYEGLLMPKSTGGSDTLIIKLDNGYNIGLSIKNTKIKKMKSETAVKKAAKIKKYKIDKGKPLISILTTGGTIASRVDYKTGGVIALETPDEIMQAIPELANIANIRMRKVFQMMSEDMEAQHWMILAEKIRDEIEEVSPDGIIITHGTDTMHFASATLALMLQNSPVPVLIVGSQRSSDRGSSDASMNLLCAAQFIANSDFSGISLCMHGSSSDDWCFIHDPLHVKKMHTSRRDAFRSIDVMPFAKVDVKGEVQYFRKDYTKRDKTRKPHIVTRFDDKIALVRLHPHFDYRVLEFYEKNGIRGIILEGTGLGHAPIREMDDYTKHHPLLLKTIERMTKNGVIIGMTSQCPYGKVNLNVYTNLRLLQNAGVLSLPMTSEAAFVKLGWVLGHTRDSKEAKKMLSTNYVGEFVDRVDDRAFLF